jgi:hypothetical protein
LVGLSLISFLLILKDLSFLRTLIVQIYHRKSDNNTQGSHMQTWFTPNHATHYSTLSIRSKQV